MKDAPPLGFLIDEAHIEPTDPFGAASPMRTVVRRKIWDGETYVDFDSSAGTAVLNRVIQAYSKQLG